MSYIIEQIKDNIDPELLLSDLGANILSMNGDDLIMSCLNPNHNDSSPSFRYDVEKHVWNCFGCDWGGDIIGLVVKVKKMSYSESIRYLKSYVNMSHDVDDEEILIKNLDYKNKKVDTSNKEVKEVVEVELPTSFDLDFKNSDSGILKYIKGRRLSTLILRKFFVGFCDSGFYANRLILPIILFDKIISFVGRATWDANNKYMFEQNADIGNMIWGLFNGYNRSNPIFVEGIFDAIRLRSYGYNAYTTFNNNITTKQINMLDEYFDDEIIICPDSDTGGDMMKRNFMKKLSNKKIIRLCSLSTPGADPDSISKVEFDKCYMESVIITDKHINESDIFIDSIIRKM